MAETDYQRMVREATEAAAARTQRSVRPPWGLSTPPGRQEGRATKMIEAMAPETPLDYAMMFAGPLGEMANLARGAKIGANLFTAAGTAGQVMAPDPAEAAWRFRFNPKLAEKTGVLPGRLANVTRQEAMERGPLGYTPQTTPPSIVRLSRGPGSEGFSLHLPTGTQPSEGLMVGTYRNADPRTSVLPHQPTMDDFIRHAYTNRGPLSGDVKHLGYWRDPATGQSYLDVSQRFDPDEIRKATKFGERTGQMAGYDVGQGRTFPIGNWEEFINSPEYRDRILGMGRVGRRFLASQGQQRWWDVDPFLEIYGEGAKPQIAGLTAATAPNTAPRPNVQTMTEYMRRLIRGEPVLQPDWRIPAGTMSRQEGSQIGMEQSRAGNLLRAQQGEPLSGMKVGQEQAALMGDPEAVVIDRHLVRVGEAPERGIFASTQEGTIGSDKNYNTQMAATRRIAHEAGAPPRDLSAEAWTGARDTIQRTDQLYGTPYRGAAVPGESKSYSDHLRDLLADKAAHLRTTVPDLKKRLAGGDAELLSAVFGVPAALQWLSDREAPSP